jgi:hypothetical protein
VGLIKKQHPGKRGGAQTHSKNFILLPFFLAFSCCVVAGSIIQTQGMKTNTIPPSNSFLEKKKKRRQIDWAKEYYKRDSRPEIQFRKQLRHAMAIVDKKKKKRSTTISLFFSLPSSPLHFASLSRYKK